jgi:hypothetical protein
MRNKNINFNEINLRASEFQSHFKSQQFVETFLVYWSDA